MLFSLPIRPARGRGRAGAGAGAAALAVALLLGGCTGSPEPSASPSPNSTESATEPVFESDEEALAAAVEAYQAFEEVSQAIAADGGHDSDRIDAVVTERYAPQLKEEFDQYVELGLHTQGQATIDSVRLAEQVEVAGRPSVSIYLCSDVSSVRVLDAAGADVTPATRDDRTPLMATVVASSDGQLRVDQVELWPGDDFCS